MILFIRVSSRMQMHTKVIKYPGQSQKLFESDLLCIIKGIRHFCNNDPKLYFVDSTSTICTIPGNTDVVRMYWSWTSHTNANPAVHGFFSGSITSPQKYPKPTIATTHTRKKISVRYGGSIHCKWDTHVNPVDTWRQYDNNVFEYESWIDF